jgi:hypothetical protein
MKYSTSKVGRSENPNPKVVIDDFSANDFATFAVSTVTEGLVGVCDFQIAFLDHLLKQRYNGRSG